MKLLMNMSLAVLLIAMMGLGAVAQAMDYEIDADMDVDVDAYEYEEDDMDYDDPVAVSAPGANVRVGPQGQVDVETNASTVKVGPQGQVSVKGATSVDGGRASVNVNPQGHVSVRGSPEAIRAMLESDDDLDADDLGATGAVDISPGRIVAGDVTVEMTDKTLRVAAGGTTVQIVMGEGRVHIKDGDVEVESEAGIQVDDQKVKVGGIEIKLPSQAISAELRERSKKVELVTEDDKPVYAVETEEDERFLFLFPVKVPVRVSVDAATGETIRARGPWWSFLSF